jgi:formylglycine-generating enzyme required for sulfatase activity
VRKADERAERNRALTAKMAAREAEKAKPTAEPISPTDHDRAKRQVPREEALEARKKVDLKEATPSEAASKEATLKEAAAKEAATIAAERAERDRLETQELSAKMTAPAARVPEKSKPALPESASPTDTERAKRQVAQQIAEVRKELEARKMAEVKEAALKEATLKEAARKEEARKTAERAARDRLEKQELPAKMTAPPAREPEKSKPDPEPGPTANTPTNPKTAVAAVAVPRSPEPSSQTFQDCADCPFLVRVPAGSFTMGQSKGDPSAAPQHTVAVRAFAIGQYAVRVGEWKACVAGSGCNFTPRMVNADDRTPVHNISWDDAQQFILWLSRATGQKYRLPTEAEWEYAARANTTTLYWWGDNVGAMLANCTDCGGSQDAKTPMPVGSFKPNPFGIYDVHGGVAQWVADCWFANYQGAPVDGSSREQRNCQSRVLRGGSFRNGRELIASSARNHYDASVRYIAHGFRVARDLN